MPELPEVETIRRELERDIVGKRIKTVEVTNNRSIRRHGTRKQFTARLDGAKITNVQRKGKYLIVKLDTEDLLVIHLGMSGQLLRVPNKEPMAKHTHVVITFTQAGQLRFLDSHTFGELFVTTPDELTTEVPELGELGIDPVEEPMSWVTFGHLLHDHPMKLKAFLTDQKILAGIGNVYSDEILFEAGLRWERQSDSLSQQEVRRLYRAISETLQGAVKYRGSSLADEGYVDLFGKPGEYQDHHQVYGREGESCNRCRRPIHRARYSNRSTFYCDACQV
jgi:formamidopyrimidine-DNA glycosylase